MTLTRRFRMLAGAMLAAVAVVLGVGVTSAVPATAATCAYTYTCVWDEPHYDGAYVAVRDSNNDWKFNMTSGSWARNKAESIYAGRWETSCRNFFYSSESRAGYFIYFYEYQNSQGKMWADGDLGNDGGGYGEPDAINWANTIESNWYYQSC